jgi:hypothetical protein
MCDEASPIRRSDTVDFKLHSLRRTNNIISNAYVNYN